MPQLQVALCYLWVMTVRLASLVCSQCVNSHYTALIDSEIERLEWMDLTHNDYINASLDAYMADESCTRADIHDNSERTSYNDRTMCPWTYVNDVDVDRFPVQLRVAKCKCSTCFDNYICKPVLYTIPVLKRQCRQGYIHWVRKMQIISTACACARPQMRYVKRKMHPFWTRFKRLHF